MSNEGQSSQAKKESVWTRELPSHAITNVTFSVLLLSSLLQAFMAYNRGLSGDTTLVFYVWCALALAQVGLLVFINVKASRRKRKQASKASPAEK